MGVPTGFVLILWPRVTKGTCSKCGFLVLKIMESLVRSRTMGVTGKRVEKWGIGGRARTMAGAGPTDPLYGGRGVPAAYRHPGSLGPHEPCPTGPRVTIVEAQEERGHLERRVGADMEDIVTFSEGSCGKRCHLRVPAEESDEVTSCSSDSKTRRYRKQGLPELSKGDADTAMEMTPSPVPRMFSALSDSRYTIHITLLMMPAQSQMSWRGGRIPPQILNLLMT